MAGLRGLQRCGVQAGQLMQWAVKLLRKVGGLKSLGAYRPYADLRSIQSIHPKSVS